MHFRIFARPDRRYDLASVTEIPFWGPARELVFDNDVDHLARDNHHLEQFLAIE